MSYFLFATYFLTALSLEPFILNMPAISKNMLTIERKSIVCISYTIERKFSKYYFTENLSLFFLEFALVAFIALIARFAYRLLFSYELLPIN